MSDTTEDNRIENNDSQPNKVENNFTAQVYSQPQDSLNLFRDMKRSAADLPKEFPDLEINDDDTTPLKNKKNTEPENADDSKKKPNNDVVEFADNKAPSKTDTTAAKPEGPVPKDGPARTDSPAAKDDLAKGESSKPDRTKSDRAQEWNNKIGNEFFNGGANKNQWNGDANGFQKAINEARQSMTPEEFKAFANKIEQGTNGFFKHTETADGNVKDITFGDGARINEKGELQYTNSKGEVTRTRTPDGKEFAYHDGPDGKRVAVEDKRIEKYGEDHKIPEYRQEQLKKLAGEMGLAHSKPLTKDDLNSKNVTQNPDDPNWQGVRKMNFGDYANFLDDLAGRKDLTEHEKAYVMSQMVSELDKSQGYRESTEESALKKAGRGIPEVKQPGKFVISTEDANPATLREGNPSWSRHHVIDINRDGYHGEKVGWAKDEAAMKEAVRKHEVEDKSKGNLLRVGTSLGSAVLDLATGSRGGSSVLEAARNLANGGLDAGSSLASLHTGHAILAYRREQNQMAAYAREFRNRMVKK